MLHLHVWYDPSYVVASILIAVWSCVAVLIVSPRIKYHEGINRWLWILTAAICWGGGVWCMHFIGMLGMRTAFEPTYDLPITLISLALPIIFGVVAFNILHRHRDSPAHILLCGFLFGTSIVAMHYTGMQAMRMPATLEFHYGYVALSYLVALVASTVGIRLSIWHPSFLVLLTAPVVLGFAIFGMHYIGMYAASFHPIPSYMNGGWLNRISMSLAVTLVITIVLNVGVIIACHDRWKSQKDAEKAIR